MVIILSQTQSTLFLFFRKKPWYFLIYILLDYFLQWTKKISLFLQGKFTTKSDVWAFAVTMWEILTFARQQPYSDMVDDKVIENVSHFYHNDGLQMYLPQPSGCPKEIYDLMKECWQRNEHDRPNFREIHLFLQRKNLGYAPHVWIEQ